MTTALASPRSLRRPRATWLSSPLVNQLKAPVVCIGLTLLVWQLLCLGNADGFPGPIQVIRQTWDPYISKPFYDDGGTSKGIGLQILISLQRVAIGYTLAAVIGIAAGMAIGLNAFLRRGFDPLIQVLRTVPPLAWLPISLLLLQQADSAAIFVIFITAVWPIVINTAVGIREIPQDYTNVARVLRLRKRSYVRDILLPATAPYVFTGLRISVGLAWLAIVAAEMLKADGGIGFFIWDAYNAGGDSSTSQIILAILVVGLVGLALDRLVGLVGDRVAAGGR
ncbi:nitrate ABC transporter permease [Vulcanococcus limneticus]|uniref:nitrate ABC transporter permease n=1 Tax=Vulcanococcus limneticus TaxID=2170428 RepID=UPI000B97FD10|nr:nitrate ABC transporter permease [Vulcanococcus limneticus]MCP9791211.1 nitrate ABC transporter permease [Vulcanococcus limneticus MW73D5]MCP9893533.1 nitrate ABC transporter permease [Vulcanococcus limneticus Candia 3F8]MCP9896609.1 nitrate ABC transporter permease [Vulcanococcus limneticus Candia 3B3]